MPGNTSRMALPVLVFDVNETLLDLRALDPAFTRTFGDAAARSDWFKQLLHLAVMTSLLPAYEDFTALGAAAATMIAEQRGIALSDEAARHLVAGMRELPPHPDVAPALERLASAGFRLAALTNSAAAAAEAQLRFAGIRERFEAVLSVDLVRRYKPAPEVYRMAAERLGVAPGDAMLVAAHAWDVWGAMNAGLLGAFVARPGQARVPLAPEPTIAAPTLLDASERIIAR